MGTLKSCCMFSDVANVFVSSAQVPLTPALTSVWRLASL